MKPLTFLWEAFAAALVVGCMTQANDETCSERPTPNHIMQVGLGFWSSRALLSAIDVGLFTELANHPRTLTHIQQGLGLHERGARDFLDALVALNFLERNDSAVPPTYQNTAETDMFLDKNKSTYIGGYMEMASKRLYPFWGGLTDALRTGHPQDSWRNGQESVFDSLYANPNRLEMFLSAMTGLSRPANIEIARKFPWHDYKTFADIGCAQGDLPVQIVKVNPHLTGVGFDLPTVEPIFESYIQKHEADDRVSFIAGDFFKRDLPKADVIIMGHVLHDWGLDDKKVLVKKVYDALPEGGAFLVYESLIDDERRENAVGLLRSLNMLINTDHGFDFTGADCQEWMKEAGFTQTRVEHLVGPDSMVVGIK